MTTTLALTVFLDTVSVWEILGDILESSLPPVGHPVDFGHFALEELPDVLAIVATVSQFRQSAYISTSWTVFGSTVPLICINWEASWPSLSISPVSFPASDLETAESTFWRHFESLRQWNIHISRHFCASLCSDAAVGSEIRNDLLWHTPHAFGPVIVISPSLTFLSWYFVAC